MCLEMFRIKDGTDKARIATINLTFENRVGFKYEKMMHPATSDRAVKGIAKAINQDEDACDMRDCDKIGKSSIGDRTTMRKKV